MTSRVVITDANSALGRATALEFARKGARIALISPSEDGLILVAQDILGHGVKPLMHVVPMTDSEEMKRAARSIALEWGGIDVWVNHAAVVVNGHPVKQVLDQAFYNQVIGMRAALPYLNRSRRDGHEGLLIGTLSVAHDFSSRPQCMLARATHQAAARFYQNLRDHLKERDVPVRVETVLPKINRAPRHKGAKALIPVQEAAHTIVKKSRAASRTWTSTVASLAKWSAGLLFVGIAGKKLIESLPAPAIPVPQPVDPSLVTDDALSIKQRVNSL